ncbi:hypothetical protein A4X13_0g7251 [Tilletia indica]|uniref:Uncharacterized protein n=1 Tax=Tilletia indica TaxID=43049 RepID=A0A177TAT2_9BASI|nr:hypothetical protein A4X13_0g7251 [Tilletia indica]
MPEQTLDTAIANTLVDQGERDEKAARVRVTWSNAARSYVFKGSDEPAADIAVQTVNLMLSNSSPDNWPDYLFGVRRNWDHGFGEAGRLTRLHHRDEVNGVKLFDQRWRSYARMNGISEFERIFDVFTRKVLSGLCWSNVLVAGGGTLRCLTEPESAGQLYSASDIDIFLHGLNSEAANAKLMDIEMVLRRNVPDFGSHFSITRTISTVTFIPKITGGPYRKVQVVLRLFRNPGEILANFDLDQAAVGYDGQEVWVEPRAGRAIFTGYTHATMKMLRRTSAGRLAKYSMRGYGVVFRVGHQDDRASRALAVRLNTTRTAAYDWVSDVIRARRTTDKPMVAPHCSVNMTYVVSAVRAKMGGAWLDNFNNFAALVVLWEHAAGNDRTVRELAEALLRRELPYGAVENFDYDECSNVANELEADEWYVAITATLPAGGTIRRTKTSPQYCIWAQTDCTTVAQTLANPLLFYVYLPCNALQVMRTCSRSVAREDRLAAVTNCPTCVDLDGHKFELHTWVLSGSNMWQPLSGMDHHVHDLLRNCSISSAWKMRRASLGVSWPKLRFSSIATKMLLDMRTPATVKEDKADLDEWLRG